MTRRSNPAHHIILCNPPERHMHMVVLMWMVKVYEYHRMAATVTQHFASQIPILIKYTIK